MFAFPLLISERQRKCAQIHNHALNLLIKKIIIKFILTGLGVTCQVLWVGEVRNGRNGFSLGFCVCERV